MNICYISTKQKDFQMFQNWDEKKYIPPIITIYYHLVIYCVKFNAKNLSKYTLYI